ncbi:HD domain-containing protein [Clostridium niameyense]|uniref:HD domain-containing protein n=1 Tax=Clostridium niameyense TaxID=1622073 RepID=UPI00067F5DDE|nr:HD domain-containing protein [Clostridium niameyense]
MDNNIKELFNNISKHIMEDEKPSNYLNYLYEKGELERYPFNMISSLKSIEQSPKYHPEGSVWNHIMLVLDNAALKKNRSCDIKVFMWAVLLHDIGKSTTTKIRKGRITSYNHDIEGEKLAKEFLSNFTQDEEFIKRVSMLVRWHMQPLYVNKNLSFKNIESMKKEVPIKEVALISLCDRLGRGGMTEEKIKEEKENIRNFLYKCKSCNK